MQNPRREIGPCSSLPKNYHPGKVGRTIIDPNSKDTYLLNKEIGSSSYGCCRVYRALYSEFMEENGTLVRSGQVTLKTINKNLHENVSTEIQLKIDRSISYNPSINIIGLKKTFRTEELLCVSLPYMSEGSLRYILSTRPNKKLPEDFIAIVLKEVLVGLRDDLHVDFNPRAHKTLNAGDIFVHIDDATGEMLIKLAFEASVYDYENINTEEEDINEESSSFLDLKSISKWGSAPEVFERDGNTRGPKSDIWLLGMTALELAYGNFPVRNREDLDCIIKNLRNDKRFPRSLEKLLITKKGTSKKKEKVFTGDFEMMVLNCLSENPEERPTADQLLNIPFFTMQRDMNKFRQFVLNAENNQDPTDN